MPYVNVPNDLSKIKTKMAFNLTKRQLICFGGAAAIGIPSYLLARESLENAEDKKTDERDLAAVGESGAHSPEDGHGDAGKGGNADTYSEKDVPSEGGES